MLLTVLRALHNLFENQNFCKHKLLTLLSFL